MLNDEGRVLMTIEDPVEYQTAGINQIEVNFKSGLTFARVDCARFSAPILMFCSWARSATRRPPASPSRRR